VRHARAAIIDRESIPHAAINAVHHALPASKFCGITVSPKWRALRAWFGIAQDRDRLVGQFRLAGSTRSNPQACCSARRRSRFRAGAEAPPFFSFGCVLYEMLTGRRAFEGQSAASVIAAILECEPALRRACYWSAWSRSLAKDPDQRFQTSRDLKATLIWPLKQPPAAAVAKARSRAPWAAVAAALAAALAVALWAPWRGTVPSPPSPQPLVRLDVDLGNDVSLGSALGPDVILSPMGYHFWVFVSAQYLEFLGISCHRGILRP
jgi:hypothetical protein